MGFLIEKSWFLLKNGEFREFQGILQFSNLNRLFLEEAHFFSFLAFSSKWSLRIIKGSLTYTWIYGVFEHFGIFPTFLHIFWKIVKITHVFEQVWKLRVNYAHFCNFDQFWNHFWLKMTPFWLILCKFPIKVNLKNN